MAHSQRAQRTQPLCPAVILATRALGIVASSLAFQRPLPLHCPALGFDLAQCSHCQGNPAPVRRQRLQDESLNFSIDRERSRLLALRPSGATATVPIRSLPGCRRSGCGRRRP